MRLTKLAKTGLIGVVVLGLSATGYASSAGTASAPAIDFDLSKIHDIEKGVTNFLEKDPYSINIEAEVEKLTGVKVKGLNRRFGLKGKSKSFKAKSHKGVMIHVHRKKAKITIKKRKSGKIVKRGKVRKHYPKIFKLKRGKYIVTAKRGGKSAQHRFKITKKRGANVFLHLKK